MIKNNTDTRGIMHKILNRMLWSLKLSTSYTCYFNVEDYIDRVNNET